MRDHSARDHHHQAAEQGRDAEEEKEVGDSSSSPEPPGLPVRHRQGPAHRVPLSLQEQVPQRGKHDFEVVAIDAGNADPTPAMEFRVKRKHLSAADAARRRLRRRGIILRSCGNNPRLPFNPLALRPDTRPKDPAPVPRRPEPDRKHRFARTRLAAGRGARERAGDGPADLGPTGPATSRRRRSGWSCSSARGSRSGTGAGTRVTTRSPTACCPARRAARAAACRRPVRDHIRVPVRPPGPRPRGARACWASLWFAAGAVTMLATGRVTFSLGVVFGSSRCVACSSSAPRPRSATRPRRAVRCRARWPRCSPASPPRRARKRLALGNASAPRRRRCRCGPDPAPEPRLSGREPPATLFAAFVPVLLHGATLYITRGQPDERRFRWVVVAYVIVTAIVWLFPNPLGNNVVRLPALFGGPLLLAILLARRPRVLHAIAVLILATAAFDVPRAGARPARSAGDESTRAGYYHGLQDWLRAHGGKEARVEVLNYAQHLGGRLPAPEFQLARMARAARPGLELGLLRRPADEGALREGGWSETGSGLRRASRRAAAAVSAGTEKTDPE